MIQHKGGFFSHTRVILDDQTYEGCAFDSCEIVYTGAGPYNLSNCTFDSCTFKFEGAAALTLKFLSDIYKLNPELVEGTFNNVRAGV